MGATIDGVPWTAACVFIGISSGNTSVSGTDDPGGGFFGASRAMIVGSYVATRPGTFAIDFGLLNIGFQSLTFGAGLGNSSNEILTITTFAQTGNIVNVAGSFSFNTSGFNPRHVVTGGVFNISCGDSGIHRCTD